MKAWQIDAFDGIEKVHLATLPEPAPGPGEARLRLQYAALNPADYYLAMGQYPAKPPLPHVLGRDGIGVVESVGDGVTGLHPGDVRLILRGETGVERQGTFAEKVVVPADELVEVPAGWTPEEAAGASLVYLTAWQAMHQFGDLPGPCTTLVTGASGGVGSAVVRLAGSLGHSVVALSRSESKRNELLRIGATVALDPETRELPKAIREALSGGRVDLAIDNVGGTGFNDLLAVMNMNGRISCVGRLAGAVPEFNTASLFFRRLTIRGVAVGTYETSEARDAWKQIVATLDRGKARPLVDEVFDFASLPEAFDRLKAGPLGKVLIRVG